MTFRIDQWDIDLRPWGWLRLRESSGKGPTVYLQFQVGGTEKQERLDLKAVVMRAGESDALSGRVWRRIPLASLENALLLMLAVPLSSDAEEEVRKDLAKNRAAFTEGVSGASPPSLDSLDDFFEATEDVMLVHVASTPSGMLVSSEGRIPQIRPPQGRLTDEFLRDVADAYRHLTDMQKSPAPAIAEMAEVPVRTVHRWVYEARKRGILPPARSGRAG